jgi:hypothetical protein
MKTLIAAIAITTLLSRSVLAGDTNSLKATNVLVFTNNTDSGGGTETNLASFFPDVQLANASQMLATNGMECELIVLDQPNWHGRPPFCLVSAINYSTNFIGCLRMPATVLCRIALLDKQGQQVLKTKLGKTYGLPLLEEQIDLWRRQWSNPHERMLIRMFPNGIPKFADARTDICLFSIKDAFEIKEAGEYELHLQMRLVQIGQDSSGKLHFPVTWLPEVIAKVQITPEDVSKPKWWEL